MGTSKSEMFHGNFLCRSVLGSGFLGRSVQKGYVRRFRGLELGNPKALFCIQRFTKIIQSMQRFRIQHVRNRMRSIGALSFHGYERVACQSHFLSESDLVGSRLLQRSIANCSTQHGIRLASENHLGKAELVVIGFEIQRAKRVGCPIPCHSRSNNSSCERFVFLTVITSLPLL